MKKLADFLKSNILVVFGALMLVYHLNYLSYGGAALAIGLAAIGAGIALASGAPAAIGAVAEDPKSFGKAMIFVALGEAVAIYGFIIAFLMILPTLQ